MGQQSRTVRAIAKFQCLSAVPRPLVVRRSRGAPMAVAPSPRLGPYPPDAAAKTRSRRPFSFVAWAQQSFYVSTRGPANQAAIDAMCEGRM